MIIVVPACIGNELTAAGPKDVLCPQALALCADTPAPDDRMFWIYTGPPGVTSPTPQQWTRTGQACLGPGARVAQAIPAFTLADFRRLPLPRRAVRIQPPNLRTLVNVPTNVFVDAPATTLRTTLLGIPVQVRATAATFHWTFGEGARLDTTDPGGAYPDLRTTHTYTRSGTRTVTLVVDYQGEYSITAGVWLPITGVAQVASPAVVVTVMAARAELVQDTLTGG